MVVEHAHLVIDPASSGAFEEAVATASTLLERAAGYGGYTLSRCIEKPAEYLLQIRWATLEDHTEKFRANGLEEWRAIVGPHLVDAHVTHHEYVAV